MTSEEEDTASSTMARRFDICIVSLYVCVYVSVYVGRANVAEIGPKKIVADMYHYE